MTSKDELTIIDEAIAELEERRTEIINRMGENDRPKVTTGDASVAPANVIMFPSRPSVIETTYNTPRHIW